MPPYGKIGVDSFARTDTQKNAVHEQAQNNRHRNRQKQYGKRSEKCMQQLKARKQPGLSYPMKSKGVQDAGCGGNFGVQLRK